MNRILTILTLAFALVLTLGRQDAAAVLINFDVGPKGAVIPSGTNIRNTYSDLGVTFGCFPGTVTASNLCAGNPTSVFGAGDVFAVSALSPFPAASAPNVISLTPNQSGTLVSVEAGFFSATFSSLQNQVSIAAKPVNGGETPFLLAFNSLGNQIGQANYPVGCLVGCPYLTLSITSSTNQIKFAAFSSDSGVLGEFDNFGFSAQKVAVPEPASILLLGLGLVGLTMWRGEKRA